MRRRHNTRKRPDEHVVPLLRAALASDAVLVAAGAIRRGEPRRPPLTRSELADRGLTPTFDAHMRAWKGFVSD
jgi:hypothetical protein